MMDESKKRPPAGAAVLRPDKTRAIVEAAFRELADVGYRGLTMDRVAARAGVGKAALYRRWPSKDAMLVDFIGRVGARRVLPPNEGSLRADLLAFVREAIAALGHPTVARVALELQAEARGNPELERALAERYRQPRRAAGLETLRRAMDRGELSPDADVELTLDLLAGPLLMRGLLTEEPFDEDYAPRLVDAVLRVLSVERGA